MKSKNKKFKSGDVVKINENNLDPEVDYGIDLNKLYVVEDVDWGGDDEIVLKDVDIVFFEEELINVKEHRKKVIKQILKRNGKTVKRT